MSFQLVNATTKEVVDSGSRKRLKKLQMAYPDPQNWKVSRIKKEKQKQTKEEVKPKEVLEKELKQKLNGIDHGKAKICKKCNKDIANLPGYKVGNDWYCEECYLAEAPAIAQEPIKEEVKPVEPTA